MELQKRHLTGLEYLGTITSLLQSIRLEDRFTGLYEAADLQWWWREDDASNPDRQVFWCDGEMPVAALLLYDDRKGWNCDFLRLPSLPTAVAGQLVAEVLRMLSRVPTPATMTVREDDSVLREALDANGWHNSGEATIQTWLAAAPSAATMLPVGFRFEARAESSGRPHPMANRNGNPADVEKRLSECSLYRPDLDYAIVHSSGEVAAYALFWLDPTTRVGLIEPMRTEDKYQRKGLGAALVCEGTRCLRGRGAETIKVSYKEGNEAARRLYHRCGFRDLSRKMVYQKGGSDQGAAADADKPRR